MIAIIIVLLTANFKDWVLKAELWQAIFIVMLVVLGSLTIRSSISYFKNKKDIDSVISDIKKRE